MYFDASMHSARRILERDEEFEMLWAELEANQYGNAMLVVLGVYQFVVPFAKRAFHLKRE